MPGARSSAFRHQFSPVLSLDEFAQQDPPDSLGNKTALWQRRRDAVKQVAQESWDAYEKHALGHDELKPLSLRGEDTWGGLAFTLIDALDTLWMMGLTAEFGRARDWVSQNLEFEDVGRISLFETTIRVLGGLLSAHELSGDAVFLQKAEQLGGKMLPHLNLPGRVLPSNYVDLNADNATLLEASAVVASLAEFGSCQVEFTALSRLTGNRSYAEAAERSIHHLHAAHPEEALLPTSFNTVTGAKIDGIVSAGSMADSYYEYLLKVYLQTGSQDEALRARWESAMDDILLRLTRVASSGVMIIGMEKYGRFAPDYEHLVCWLPGSFALGATSGAVKGAVKAAYYLQVAANMTKTCYGTYRQSPTGLGPETGMFTPAGDFVAGDRKWLMRPEVVEALFYMWRATHDTAYREWGWEIFQSYQEFAKTTHGTYAAIKDVYNYPIEHEDSHQSFWLSETLKYLWLLFGPDTEWPLDDWIFNTEAHPVRAATSGL